MSARHVRSRGPRERYSPSVEDQRPQLGGELGPDLLQRQIDQLGAREGDCVFELPLDEVAEKIAAHMRRPEQEILQKAKLLEHCMQRAVWHSTREVVRRQLQRSMQGDGQQEDREDEDDELRLLLIRLTLLRLLLHWLLKHSCLTLKHGGLRLFDTQAWRTAFV